MPISISWSGGAPTSPSVIGLGVSSSGKLYPKESAVPGSITGIRWIPQETVGNGNDLAGTMTEYGPYSVPMLGSVYFSLGVQADEDLLDVAKGYLLEGYARAAVPYPFAFAAKLEGSLGSNLSVEWRALWTSYSDPAGEVEVQTTRQGRNYLEPDDAVYPFLTEDYTEGSSVWNHGIYYGHSVVPANSSPQMSGSSVILPANYFLPEAGTAQTARPCTAPPQVWGFNKYAFVSFRRWESFSAGYDSPLLNGDEEELDPSASGPDGQMFGSLGDQLVDDPGYWLDDWTTPHGINELQATAFFWSWGEVVDGATPLASARRDRYLQGARNLLSDLTIESGRLRLQALIYDDTETLVDTYEVRLYIYSALAANLPQRASFWANQDPLVFGWDLGGDDEPCSGIGSCTEVNDSYTMSPYLPGGEYP